MAIAIYAFHGEAKRARERSGHRYVGTGAVTKFAVISFRRSIGCHIGSSLSNYCPAALANEITGSSGARERTPEDGSDPRTDRGPRVSAVSVKSRTAGPACSRNPFNLPREHLHRRLKPEFKTSAMSRTANPAVPPYISLYERDLTRFISACTMQTWTVPRSFANLSCARRVAGGEGQISTFLDVPLKVEGPMSRVRNLFSSAFAEIHG